MRIQVDDVRLFFDVHGTKLVPDGPVDARAPDGRAAAPRARLRPRARSRCRSGRCSPSERRSIYLDMRGRGRSDPGRPEEHRLERGPTTSTSSAPRCGIERPIVLGLGFGGIVALDYAARYPGPSGRARADRTGRADRARALDRGLRAARRRGGGRDRDARSTASWTSRLRRLPPRLLPAALDVRPHERRDRARRTGAREVLIAGCAARRRSRPARVDCRRPGAGARARRRGRSRSAPLESAREVADLLGRRDGVPQRPGARHSIFRDAPDDGEPLHRFLDRVGRERSA